MTGFYSFSPSGVDHTMRAGRVSWRRGVLRLDGVGRDEAYHGARSLLITRSAPFTFSAGYRPTSLLWRRDPRLHGHVQMLLQPVPSLTAFRTSRCRISRWPYNRLDAMARNAPAHYGPHRSSGPRVPSACCQESRRPYSTKRYESCSRLLW